MQPSPPHAKTTFCHTNHPRAIHGLFTFTGDCCTTHSTALFIYLFAFFLHWNNNKTYRISKRNAGKKKHLSLLGFFFFFLFVCFLQICLLTWNVFFKGYRNVLFPSHRFLKFIVIVNLHFMPLTKYAQSAQAVQNCSPTLSWNITIMHHILPKLPIAWHSTRSVVQSRHNVGLPALQPSNDKQKELFQQSSLPPVTPLSCQQQSVRFFAVGRWAVQALCVSACPTAQQGQHVWFYGFPYTEGPVLFRVHSNLLLTCTVSMRGTWAHV